MKYKHYSILIIITLFFITPLFAQNSIHIEEQKYYNTHGIEKDNRENSKVFKNEFRGLELNQQVFGYHPYWIGNEYQSYPWNLLSDLCYFSYEINSSTGEPISTHSFLTAAVIDTALHYGTKVHLCATLFSGHASFFSNQSAMDTFTQRMVELVKQRKIHGINLDLEAVPSSQNDAMCNFVIAFSQKVKSEIPGCIISMATPSVNWNNTFDLSAMEASVDLFMVMAYDYYWNGSSVAGPVAPLYPMENSYKYSAVQTIQYYLGLGLPASKILLGVPYYGRSWPVNSPLAPSTVRGSGSALKYRSIKANITYYNWESLRFEPNSRHTYYSYDLNGWNHCFTETFTSLGQKYDQVLGYGLAGIGIWALGYDDGYPELWEQIASKFGTNASASCSDTLFDNGGPAYVSNAENSHSFILKPSNAGPLKLMVHDFSSDAGTLNIYDGENSSAELKASFPGSSTPMEINLGSGMAFLDFVYTTASSATNYRISWQCGSSGIVPVTAKQIELFVIPGSSCIQIKGLNDNGCFIELFDLSGRLFLKQALPFQRECTVEIPQQLKGAFVARIQGNGFVQSRKLNHF